MSAKYIQIHIAPKDQAALDRILQFESLVRENDASGIKSLDGSDLLEPIDLLTDQLDINFIDKKDSQHVVVDFLATTSIDMERLLRFLVGLGANRLEAEVYNSQVGEYDFYLDADLVDSYDATAWEWLENPVEEEGDDQHPDLSKLHSPYREVAAMFEKDNIVAAFRTLTGSGVAGASFADLAANAPAPCKDHVYGRDDDEPGVYLRSYREQQGSASFCLVLNRDTDRDSLRWPTLDDLSRHVASLGVEGLTHDQDDDETYWGWVADDEWEIELKVVTEPDGFEQIVLQFYAAN